MKNNLYLNLCLKRVLIFDGAMGTEIQKKNLKPEDFGGKELEGANDHLIITRPDIIKEIHLSYLQAGADIVETNTFGSNRLKMEEYGIEDLTYEQNKKGAMLAREAADSLSTAEYPKFVFGSIGPTGMLPSSTDESLSNITFDELREIFKEQALALIDGGCHGLLIETSQDILEVKAAVIGCDEAIEEAVRKKIIQSKDEIVLQAQITLDVTGKMLLGTDIKASLAILETLPVDSIGLNCSTGPVEMREAVRYLCENSSKPVSAIPNAGMPENIDGCAVYAMKPQIMAAEIISFLKEFGLNITGGCCGTTPEHIAALRKAVDENKITPRKPQKERLPMAASAMTAVSLIQEPAPALMGERLNAQGSRKMKEFLLADDFASMMSIANDQEEGGAHFLDVCLAANERDDEAQSMKKLVRLLSNSISLPLMIDSTESDVIETALKNIPGRPIINSINLEGDGSKIHKILPLVKKFGAAVVALTIDEKGMADTVEWKFNTAKRIYDIALNQYNLLPQDLLFDLLTFTLATGEEKYKNSAHITLKAIKKLKEELPGVLTTLGVSNVSFGLSVQARKVINSVFLYHAAKHGLDTAIINPKDIIPYPQIKNDELKLAEDLIFNKEADALQKLIAYFEDKKPVKAQVSETKELMKKMKPDERCHYQIVNRIPDDIENVLDGVLKDKTPVDVINNVLLPAMKEVGDKFGAGELILPFVLQSAEVMKKAVSYVEQFLDKNDTVDKGIIVLATVYGDVHDIGKNLVKTILSNNGFKVIDLGKQVPVNTILESAQKEKASAIGLSALLVSTSKQMGICVEELNRRKCDYPVVIGGAAINRKFSYKISYPEEGEYYKPGVFYAKDAFEGLEILNTLSDNKNKEGFVKEVYLKAEDFIKSGNEKSTSNNTNNVSLKSITIKPAPKIPEPPFWGRKVKRAVDFDEVFSLVDKNYLFKFKWGVRTKGEEYKNQIDKIFMPRLKELVSEAKEKNWLSLDLVYGYFKAVSQKDSILILDESENVLEEFAFPRQKTGEYLCLSDYIDSKRPDNLAFSAVTAGKISAKIANEMYENGELEKSYLFGGFSTQMAEALAEYIHRKVRKEWGIKNNQGLRYSFGYPGCPDLADQKKLYRLLKPEEIDLGLTEGFQMDPEQSTSALIFHHPDCSYFRI
ncbi:MAG: methionine synthase [Spirochaetia bacterium]|nr:methionine synthase [Spirochaetia bacterium]